MRMGKASRKLRYKAKPPVGSENLVPKHSSRKLVVGQVQSNVVSSVYWPLLVERATANLEQYAELMMEYDQEVEELKRKATEEWRARDLERDEEEEEEGDDDKYNLDDIDVEDEAEEGDSESTTVSPPPLDLPPSPASHFHFQTESQVDDLVESLLQPHYDHFTRTSDWKVHANTAKFERLLDEKYGPLRPFVDRYPQIERGIRNIQRKYAKGHFSPLRQGDPPIPVSTSIIMLFMMQRNKVRWEAMVLAAVFLLVGLQPWALVVLVSLGHRAMTQRSNRRVGGMPRKIVLTEPYYALRGGATATATATGAGAGGAGVGVKDLSEEEEKKRRNDLLKSPVGNSMNDAKAVSVEELASTSQDDAQYDVIILGTGPSSLYTAALLSRAGKKVLVLSMDEDASGCHIGKSDDVKWSDVPFDVQSNDVSHASRQQTLLAPALASTDDAQGGIRFARIGSERDGFAHTILSIPGVGTDSHSDSIPFVLHAGGIHSIAQDAAAVLGDGWPSSDGTTAGESATAQYLQFCETVNSTASKFYLTKVLSDEANNVMSADSYQQSGIRYAQGYLDKLVPLNGHVRAFLAGMGMKDENLRPGMLSMAAHVSNVGALCSTEGMSYPIGGPRAICKALESVIVQNGGKVLTDVRIKELIFEDEEVEDDTAKEGAAKKDGGKKDDDKSPPPQCIGISLQDGKKIHVKEDGAVVSFLGFISTFVQLLNPDLRMKCGVPRGLPALSERRPLLKLLIGLNGTAEELSITGADWYRLPNASRAFDERNPLTGEVQLGEIGLGRGSASDGEGDNGEEDPTSAVEKTEGDDDSANPARRGKHTKKSGRRNKFDSGMSWIKVSFPSAKDPSWNDRHRGTSTCVVTIEADDDFVTKFDSKPAIYSNHKASADTVKRLLDRVKKDLLENFPELEGKMDFIRLMGPVRAGLMHNPERYAAKGVRPKTLYPGLFVGGSDLTIGDSFSGSIVGGWLAANAVMEYDSFDYVFLQKHIASDLAQFMPRISASGDNAAVPFTPKPDRKAAQASDESDEKGEDAAAAPAESSKEE